MGEAAVVVTYVLAYGAIVLYAAWMHRRLRRLKSGD